MAIHAIINNVTSDLIPYIYLHIQNPIINPEGILFNGHIQTFFILLGIWLLDILFDLTLWEYVKPIRNDLFRRIKNVFTKKEKRE